jgi:hypothetical protein
MTEVERRYSRLRRQLRTRTVPYPEGPCGIHACEADSNNYQCHWHTVHSLSCRKYTLVYDHCHRHDYVRGIICIGCNVIMSCIDQLHPPAPLIQATPEGKHWLTRVNAQHPFSPTGAYLDAYIGHWEQCPSCVAEFSMRDFIGAFIAPLAP